MAEFDRSLRYDLVRMPTAMTRSKAALREQAHQTLNRGDRALAQGRYKTAATTLARAVTLFEQVFGPRHVEVAAPLNQLAMAYRYLGRFVDAGMAYQRALGTVSNNIANVGTDGYVRQETTLAEAVPRKLASMYLGTGVFVDGIRRAYDEFLEKIIEGIFNVNSHKIFYLLSILVCKKFMQKVTVL